MSPDSTVCCLTTVSHVAQSHVFAQSLARWHSGPCFCLLIDSDDFSVLPESVSGIHLRDVIDEETWKSRQARLTAFEAIMSLKPRLIRYVLRQSGKACIYLDTDILVLQDFAQRLALEDGSSILLTPHLTGPLGVARGHEEIVLLRAGVFNAGVLAVTASDPAFAFLDWWDARCHAYCLNRQSDGLFVDQRWLDLVPTLFSQVTICADPGINVGHWRIADEDDISCDSSGHLHHAGVAIALLHLSSFDPQAPGRLSGHRPLPVNPETAFGRCLADYARAIVLKAAERPPLHAPTPKPVSETTSYPAGFGINLFGQFSSATGLGVTARHTANALRFAGVPFTCFDIQRYYPTGDVAEELTDILAHFTNDPAELRFPVNLYCMPVIDFPQLVQQVAGLLDRKRFHAAVVWWEATKLHATWAQALIQLDALIAYSEFLSGVLANSLPLTPVITGRQPLFLPDGIRADRSALGLPDDATIFVSSFDPSSDPVRKNPLGVIAAFREAFPDRDADVRLVFRLNNAHATEMARQTTRMLVDAAAGDGRIGFSLEPMTYRQVLSLYASSSVYVSLHRSEGLGLGMMEAMRLGIPVIATGWSGNMSFMDHRCASLVRYRLVQVSGNHPFYRPDVLGPEAVWAEPVIEDAVAWMRHLHRHPDERRRLGELARIRVERYQGDSLALDWLHELAEIWRTAAQLPRVEGKLSGAARVP